MFRSQNLEKQNCESNMVKNLFENPFNSDKSLCLRDFGVPKYEPEVKIWQNKMANPI